jgi:hypothetical protein
MTKTRRRLVASGTAAVLLAVWGLPAALALEELRFANLAEVKGGVRLGGCSGIPSSMR